MSKTLDPVGCLRKGEFPAIHNRGGMGNDSENEQAKDGLTNKIEIVMKAGKQILG